MKTGIVGLGLMGHAFAERLLTQGLEVQVYNRTPQKAEDLVTRGAVLQPSIDSLIEEVDVILLMPSDAQAIEALLPFDDSLRGKVVLQMATIAPAQSKAIAERVQECGGDYLEAPVLGSIPEALDGSLIIMAGGEPAVFERLLPLLNALGSSPRLIGAVGSAAALKLAMNQLIAALTAGFALSLGFVQRYGVDVDQFMDTVRNSALYATTFDKKLQKYLQRDFGSANFSTRHLLKDIGLFIDDARLLGLDTGALQAIQDITARTVSQGLATSDYSSIYQVIDPPGRKQVD